MNVYIYTSMYSNVYLYRPGNQFHKNLNAGYIVYKRTDMSGRTTHDMNAIFASL